MKELKIEAPQGYEVDKENSTFECIKFKKKHEIKTWGDLCKAEKEIKGFFISTASGNVFRSSPTKARDCTRNIFLTIKEAISARAAAIISQLMPYYGGAITKEEWADLGMKKHIIYRCADDLLFSDDTIGIYCSLAFRSKEYRDEFLKNNEQLVKDYLMID